MAEIEWTAEQKQLSDLVHSQGQHGANAFFHEWYVRNGLCYFFVFRKSLAVTNIQHAELLSLVEVHAQRNKSRAVGLQFVSLADAIRAISSLFADFFGESDLNDEVDLKRSNLFALLYAELLSNTVVIQPLFGTCAVYLPPNLDLDLVRIVGESGYVHFAGRCVYISDAKDANEESFLEDLNDYLDRFCKDEQEIPFLVYSHEDWDEDDARRRDQHRFRSGVHDLKIYLDRAYIGSTRLASLIAEMKASFGDKLWFTKKRQRHLLVGEQHSLILLRDYGIGAHLRREENVHYILYDQLYHNQSPCHLFEENKPGWSAPITAPHTLFGAMLNLARPFLPPEGAAICDPFVGSGTTACEVAKLPGMVFSGSDLSPLSRHLLQDNLRFFSLNVDHIKKWENHILEIEDFELKIERVNGKMELTISNSQDGGWVARYVRERDQDHIHIDEEALGEALDGTEEVDRLTHYMTLRFVLRNEGALLRGADVGERKTRDIDDLLDQIQGLRQLRSCTPLWEDGHLQEMPWSISPAVVVSPKAFEAFDYKFTKVSAIDNEHWEGLEGSFDVIVTDPPYGYNTQEDLDSLADLYAKMIPKMIRSLRPDGHLIMCLPERSYTGRKTYSFTHKDIVVRQILMAAKSAGYEVLINTVPTPVGLYRPPYYWRSEKALSRSIIYFRLRQRSNGGGPANKKPRNKKD